MNNNNNSKRKENLWTRFNDPNLKTRKLKVERKNSVVKNTQFNYDQARIWT